MSHRLRADLLLLTMCLFWGGTFVLVKSSLHEVSTLLFLALRFGAGALALLAVGGRPSKYGALIGIFLYLGFALQTQGLHTTTPSKSAFITAFSVLLVPLGQSTIERIFPGWGTLSGIALAFIGLALLTNPLGSASKGAGIQTGDVWTLGAALAFTAHILLVGHYTSHARPLDLATGQVCTAAVLGAILTPIFETPAIHNSVLVWTTVAFTGIVCTGLGFLVQSWAQQTIDSSRAALIFSSEPVFAWITSMIVLHERLGTGATLGALMIVGGIVLSELV